MLLKLALAIIPAFIFMTYRINDSSKKTEPQQSSATNKKKFRESENTAVFTTKFVISDKKDITLVIHNATDNTWEFYSDDPYTNYESVVKIVSLKNIIDLDNSVLQVADMKGGYLARRKSKHQSWVIEKHKEK